MSIETISETRCFGGTMGFYRHASSVNQCDMRFAVFVPPQAARGNVPVVTFLSGLTCTEENFMAKAGAQRYAAELGLMLVVLVINIVVSTWQRSWAKRLKSDILLADANHTLSDVLITSSVIAGWQLSAMGWYWVDQLCALGVAGLILYLAYGLYKRTLPVLLDERAIDPDKLRAVAGEVEGVLSISRVRSRWVGSSRAADLVIEVDARLSTEAAHEIADRLENLLAERFDIHDISIHIEPGS